MDMSESSKSRSSRAVSDLWKSLLATRPGVTPVILRLAQALVIFPHGAQKLLGWWGGYGFEGTMGFFTGNLGIPWIFAFLVIMGEFFGSIMLALGLVTRLAAASQIAIMLGAITMAHLPNGFFMNWSGQQAGEGFEFHLLVIAIALTLVIRGAGSWSLDRRLSGR
jgi:putative oxidoreductase